MNDPLKRLWQGYAPAAVDYLRRGGEEGLLRAYELGREALSSGVGLLETAEIHRAAVVEALPGDGAEGLQRALVLFDFHARLYPQGPPQARVEDRALSGGAAGGLHGSGHP